MVRYLQDNFIPGFNDRSTAWGNKNQVIYNAQNTNRQKFALSAGSVDVPAQYARLLYNSPKNIKYCSICPGSTKQNIPYMKQKGWKTTSESWKDKPYLNSFNNEEVVTNDFMFKQWASTNLHKSMGCYSVQN